MRFALDIATQSKDLVVLEELLNDLDSDLDDLSKLMEELLAFSLMRVTSREVISETICLSYQMAELLCEFENERIKFEFEQTIEVIANRVSLKRALSNVIRNSLRYADSASTWFNFFDQVIIPKVSE